MSVLPLLAFLALLLPGLALARRLAPAELRGGLLPSIAVSWATLLVVLLPLVVAGYLVRLPAGALGAILVLLVVWGAVDLARAAELRDREARRALLGVLGGAASLATVVIVADLWLSYRQARSSTTTRASTSRASDSSSSTDSRTPIRSCARRTSTRIRSTTRTSGTRSSRRRARCSGSIRWKCGSTRSSSRR